MTPEQLEKMMSELKSLGPDAKIAVFAFSDQSKQMVIKFPHEPGNSTMQDASALAGILKTILGATEKQDDKRAFQILHDALAAAIIPYISGLSDQELAALALLGV